MPPAPKQERSRRAREALLGAALQLFAERGFEATSIEDIASSAGVAVGGFYLHFRSKRQALLVLMDRLLAELGALAIVLPENVPAQTIVAAIVRIGLRIDRAYAGAYRPWREVMLHDAMLAKANREIEAWTMDRLRAVASLLLRLPKARDDVDLETFCWVTNQLFWRLTEAASGDLETVEGTVTAFFYHALFED